MKVSRRNAAEVRLSLSPMAVKILQCMFVRPESIHVHHLNIATWHSAMLELMVRNIIRPAYNLLDESFITVLQPGGKYIVEILKRESK